MTNPESWLRRSLGLYRSCVRASKLMPSGSSFVHAVSLTVTVGAGAASPAGALARGCSSRAAAGGGGGGGGGVSCSVGAAWPFSYGRSFKPSDVPSASVSSLSSGACSHRL